MDWVGIGGLGMDWYIGVESALEWQIGLRLELHKLVVRQSSKDWQIVSGLELNWHFGPGLVDYHWIWLLNLNWQIEDGLAWNMDICDGLAWNW